MSSDSLSGSKWLKMALYPLSRFMPI